MALQTQTRVTTIVQERYLRAERVLERLQDQVREVERTNNQALKHQVMTDVIDVITVQTGTITVRFHFDKECVADQPTSPTSP